MSAAPADNGDTDDIFLDKGPPLGSDPFALNEASIHRTMQSLDSGAVDQKSACPTGTTEGSALVSMASLGLEHEIGYEEFLHRIASIFCAVSGGILAHFFERSLSNGTSTVRGTALSLANGEGFVSYAAVKKHAVWSEETSDAVPYFRWLADMSGVHAQRAVSIPIFIGGHCFGAVEVYDPSTKASAELTRHLTELAAVAAVAIETRLTLSQLQRAQANDNERAVA